MLKDITLGQYFPGNTVIHRLDPRTKIWMVIFYIVALFTAKWFVSYAVMLVFLIVAVRISKVAVSTILRGMKREDPAALEAAIRQYGGYVSAVVGNQLGGFAAGEDLEELVSDVFVALWQAAGTLKTEHLRGWLGRVARNQAISFLRKQRLQLISDEDYLLIDDKDAQKLLEAQERSALLTAALDKLTPGDRELFLRRYYYNQTAEQIAREKDMNAGTVRSRLARGRQLLKAELQKGDMQVEDLCAESF